MPTAEQTYQDIVQQVESNRLEEAIAAMLSFAERHSPDKVTAVRLRRSDWKALQEDALMMGESSTIRERRTALKVQLFRLADAIRKDSRSRAEAAPSGEKAAAGLAPFSSPRGEGPVHVFIGCAPEAEDQEGAEGLRKSLALLLHLRRVEVFNQQKSPTGSRAAALNNALQASEVVLLLLSNNFLADPECLNLQQEAFRLYEQNRVVIVPILFNPCEWQALDIGRLQALPRNGRFITQWDNDDEAYTGISREVSSLAKNIRSRLEYGPAPTPPPPVGEDGVSLKKDGQQPRPFPTAELLKAFRNGNTSALIRQLIDMTEQHEELYDQVLLLEQRWKAINDDEKYDTASLESISTRKNKLNQDLLRLIREMEG